MSKIRIKNFGPINEGYLENDGWLDVKKVTVFIGNQGSGKSTVAKLISLFMWLEKALIRGDIKGPISHLVFYELTEFHRLENYFTPQTEIEYEGAFYHLKMERSANNNYIKTIQLTKLVNESVGLPKIMYVPAERNFLSSIDNINKVSDLIVGSLKDFSVEFRNAQLAHKGKPLDLPINNTKVVYEPNDDQNYLDLGGKRLKLSHASSGFHSIVPLYWVTKYMVDFVGQSEEKLLKLLSTDQTIRRNSELLALNTSGLNELEIRIQEKKINGKYVSNNFVNIVEEPEQNLFPSSQKSILYSLLEFNNLNKANKLIMTTHSPYLINYLTLSVEAHKLKSNITTEELKQRLNNIVPLNATLNAEDLIVYQLNEINGTITKLKTYKGLPSDENFLNKGLEESNNLFSELLDIEDLCQ